ncbi:MAG: HAD family hydrolase [Candidatus Woesebacteria bacterium]|nr:HAD family hydrolase [Candidatus Woesebacteria bacterium]
MSKEFGLLTPIEKELRFNVWRKEKGIARFLFDLDDTICGTRKIFNNCINMASNFLGVNAPVISNDAWNSLIEETNNGLYEQFGVNPNKWNMIVDKLAKLHELPVAVQETTRSIFSQIFWTSPEMLEGGKEGLDFLVKVGVPIGIVTHAGSEWTWRKYNWLDLKRFVSWDDIFTVDQDKHKTSESWREAVKYFGLKPEECAAVGDSPRSDINPAWKAGIRQCFLVEDPKQWTVQNQSVDESVRKITNLSQIVDVINGDT